MFVYAISINWFNLFGELPDFKALENPRQEISSELWSDDSVLLGKYYRENRTYISYEDLSPELIQTFISSEDIRFYDHYGIDLKGLLAIPYYMIRGKRRGSSTITQQLAKNLFKTRTYLNVEKLKSIHPWLDIFIAKMKESILAIRLERAYTKKEIIALYLNTVDFGSNSFGIKVAAKTFFGTTPDQLSIGESALLVGMLQGVTHYSPILNPENALDVRRKVLKKLKNYNQISQKEYDSIQVLPIDVSKYRVESHNKGLAPYFRIQVRKYLIKWGKENGVDIFGDGIKIYTTLNARMQRHAESAAIQHIKNQQSLFFNHWKGKNPWVDENLHELPNFLEKAVKQTKRYRILKKHFKKQEDSIWKILHTPIPMKVFTWNAQKYIKDTILSPVDSLKYYKHFLHIGLLAMDPHTGYIKAWVGGINHTYFKYDHVRQSRRQCGSTFKPIIYASAIQERYLHPCHKFKDAPVSFQTEDTSVWTPKNSSLRYSGETYTLRQALARSINTISAHLMKKLGPERIIKYAKEHFGITSDLPAVYSLCLGTADVSLYEMVGTYGSFVNRGIWTEPTFIKRIEDRFGKVLYKATPRTIEALSEENAYIMTYMLRGSSEEKNGTGMGLHRYKFRNANQIGAKTGTTSNYSDAWFIGFSKDLVAGTWVGASDRSVHFRTLALGQGSRQAMPAFALFMEKVYSDSVLNYQKGKFPLPSQGLSTELDCEEYKRNLNKVDSTTQYIDTPSSRIGDY